MNGVLFVCLGNICRSPMAQGVLEKWLADAGRHMEVDSCGTANFNAGKAPDARAIVAAARRGYDIAGQRARQLDDSDYSRFGHILAMDQSTLAHARSRAPRDFAGEIALLRSYDRSDNQLEIPDPFNEGETAFDRVIEIIEKSAKGLLARLI